MGDIIQFPGLNVDASKFTPDALNRFHEIPKYMMKQIIESVFCPECGAGTTIIDFSGKMINSDLILTGRCKKCWGEIERLVSSKEDIFFRIIT